MDALLKRREELLKAKEEVERKLKLAAKAKKELETTEEGTEKENNNIVANGPGTEKESNNIIIAYGPGTENIIFNGPDNGSIILNSSTQKQLVWDIGGKVFAVLTDTKLVLKSFNPSNPFPKLEINLPKPASKDAKVLISGEWIAISFSESQNFIFNEGEWVQIDDSGRLVWIKNGLFLIYKEKSKILSLRDCEKLNSVIKEIEDVESFYYNDESILLGKVDGSLTI